MSTYFLLDPFEFPYYFYRMLSSAFKKKHSCPTTQLRKICRHKMSIMFNEIFINEEMLPKYTHIYIYFAIHRQICFVLSELISVARIETRLTQTPMTRFYHSAMRKPAPVE